MPIGIWEIFNTRKACCNTNFAYSDFCDIQIGPDDDQPTRHPTIAAPEDDVYEVIPIKFDVMGLPEEISVRNIKDEMKTVLKRVLVRLSERIPGLKITNVEEKAVFDHNLLRTPRALEKDLTVYFNVYVLRDDEKKFGPLIIAELRDTYEEVLDQIQ